MIRTILRLGRVSNLPTVWSNALAGAVLAGSGTPGPIVLTAVALTLFYVGGMWLNDAFDADVDRAERASRPIPQGEISRQAVFLVGSAMLAVGCLVILPLGLRAAVVALLLTGAIVLYDWLHKRTVFAPVIMGTTRFLSYALAAYAATGAFAPPALLGAVGLFAYVVGLTYAAKQEAYDRLERAWPLAILAVPCIFAAWGIAGGLVVLPFTLAYLAVVGFALRRLFRRNAGDVPQAVGAMIAGIALFDATMLAAHGAYSVALVSALLFGLTLYFQRFVPGT